VLGNERGGGSEASSRKGRIPACHIVTKKRTIFKECQETKKEGGLKMELTLGTTEEAGSRGTELSLRRRLGEKRGVRVTVGKTFARTQVCYYGAGSEGLMENRAKGKIPRVEKAEENGPGGKLQATKLLAKNGDGPRDLHQHLSARRDQQGDRFLGISPICCVGSQKKKNKSTPQR